MQPMTKNKTKMLALVLLILICQQMFFLTLPLALDFNFPGKNFQISMFYQFVFIGFQFT